MIVVKATLVGIKPLLMDAMSREVMIGLLTGVSPQVSKDRPPEEIAKRKLYIDEKGNIGLPSRMLFSCLVNAGRKVKNGKYQISNAASSTLPALLDISEEFLVFNGFADKNWKVALHLGRLPNGTAVCLVRPCFDKWGFDVTFEIDETEVSEDTIRKLVLVGGKKYGLGAWRPGCKGKFGTFRIEKWTSEKTS